MKNRLLKMFTLLLVSVVLITSLGALTVSAADVPVKVKAQGKTQVEAELFASNSPRGNTYNAYTRNYNLGNPYPNAGTIYFSPDVFMTLNYYLDVEEAGAYQLKMYVNGGGEGINYADIAVGKGDHQEHYLRGYVSRVSAYASGGVQEMDCGIVHLDQGETYLTVSHVTSQKAYYFYYFTLERVDDAVDPTKESGPFKAHTIPGIIQAEDYDKGETGSFGTGASGTYSEDKPIFVSPHRADSTVSLEPKKSGYDVMLNGGEWVNYTFNVKVADTYTLSVGAEWTGKVGVYLDGQDEAYEGSFIQSETVQEKQIASFYLDEGQHTITLRSHDHENKRTKVDYIAIMPGDNMEKPAEKIDTGIYKELYVATDGNDETGDGSRANPFASIARAKDEVAKINDDMTGDIVVYIQPGEYQIEETVLFTEEHSGKNGHKVIFKGSDIFNQPLISGGQKVTGWQPYKDGIWSAPLSGQEYVRNLYVNELPAGKATSKYYYIVTKVNPGEMGNDIAWFTIPKKNSHVNFERMDDVIFGWTRHWERNEFPVKEIRELENDWLIIPEYDFESVMGTNEAKRNGYFENAMELLDEPGEFYYNKEEERIYYYPFREEDMTTAVTYVGDTEKIFKLEGESITNKIENIVFDNLKIMYGAWNFPSKYGFRGTQGDGSADPDVEKTALYIDQLAGQIEIDNADGIEIKNCEIACNASCAIDMETNVNNVLIEGCIIRDTSGTGIKIGRKDGRARQRDKGVEICENIDILNNIIIRPGGEFYNSPAISLIYGVDIDILHNIIKDTPYSGMHLNWGWNDLTEWVGGDYDISYNRIENVMQMTRDGGGTYIFSETNGALFSYNYYKNHDSPFDGLFFYNDAGTKHVTYHHNVTEDGGEVYGYPSEGYGYTDQTFYKNYTYNSYKLWGMKREYAPEHHLNLEPPIEIRPGDEWPQEALDIIAGAGLSPEYKSLETKLLQYPEWRPVVQCYVPEERVKAGAKANWGIHVEAEDYMLGGEGVAYHKHRSVNRYNGYRAEMDVSLLEILTLEGGTWVVDTNAKGEWLKYEFEIPESGYYKFKYNGNSIQRSVTDGNYTPVAKILIDDEEATQITIPWHSEDDKNNGNYRAIYGGEYYLEAGKHTLTMEFINAHYFNWFKFYTDEMEAEYEANKGDFVAAGENDNDPTYDDGKIVAYEDAVARLFAVKEARATLGGIDMPEFWAANPKITTDPKGGFNG